MRAPFISNPQKYINYYNHPGRQTHRYQTGGGLGNTFSSLNSKVVPLDTETQNTQDGNITPVNIQSPSESTVKRAKELVYSKRGIKRKKQTKRNTKNKKIKRRKSNYNRNSKKKSSKRKRISKKRKKPRKNTLKKKRRSKIKNKTVRDIFGSI